MLIFCFCFCVYYVRWRCFFIFVPWLVVTNGMILQHNSNTRAYLLCWNFSWNSIVHSIRLPFRCQGSPSLMSSVIPIILLSQLLKFCTSCKSLNLLCVHTHLQIVSQLADVILNWQGRLMLNGLLVLGQDKENLKYAVTRTGIKVSNSFASARY